MIFLSKHGQDNFINMFAQGSGTTPTNLDHFDYEKSSDPIVLRGILKYKLMQRCLKDRRTFYYMDTGYFGNTGSYKEWHRIVRNGLQHSEIIPRPADRFQKFGKKFQPWRRGGRNILIAMPDDKPCKFYGIDRDTWLQETVSTLKQHTDRPIIVRERAPKRSDRLSDTLEQALNKDVFALVTFNSIAAVDSIFAGIPAFTLAPTHAASPVSLDDLSRIETPYYPDKDKVYAWACHLAYGQYHVNELKNGTAWRMINENIMVVRFGKFLN